MRQGKFLKFIFNNATSAFNTAGPGSILRQPLLPLEWILDKILFPITASAPLTDGEKSFVASIFGNEIDTRRVKKYFTSKKKKKVSAETFGSRKIKFYNSVNPSADLSQAGDVFPYLLLIHEMTHVWQAQHKLRKSYTILRHPTLSYDYTLSPNSRFGDFGLEQQASIIEDYATAVLYHGPRKNLRPSGLYAPAFGPRTALQSLSLLQKVVEDQFPEARKTRLTLEAKQPPPQSRPATAPAPA